MNIPEITLNNGMKIPQIGLGTWGLSGKKCEEVVKNAVELGYRHFDTAESYGNEKEIGNAIKSFNRKDFFIVSKVSPDKTYEQVIKACDNSLARLQTDYIDLYLIHAPTETLKETLMAMKKLLDDKKIRAIGVSNFGVFDLEEAIGIANKLVFKITVNQIDFSPGLYPREIESFCKKFDIAVVAYSPLGRGKITNNKTIKNISHKYAKSSAQIALKWLMQKGAAVIPKASSSAHLKENLGLDFNIDEEDIKKIDLL